MNSLLFSLSYQEITDLVLRAEDRVIYCSPNIFSEIAVTLAAHKIKIKDMRVILTLEEGNYRNGYGDIASIEILKKAGIPIFHIPNNLVSFIIIDDYGYFIFPQSELLKEEAKLLNAIEMDGVTIVRLLAQLFPPISQQEVSDLHEDLSNAIEQEKSRHAEASNEICQGGSKGIERIDEVDLKKISASLKANPPLAANLKKMLDVYAAKIRFVDLEFSGLQFAAMKVELPKKAMPLSNPDLLERLQTKMQLFNNAESSIEVERIRALGQEERAIRKQYLIHLPEYKKNVFRKKDEAQFKAMVESLRQSIEAAGKQLSAYITDEIEATKTLLKAELLEIYKKNRLPKYAGEAGEEQMKKDIAFIVSRLEFPKPEDITGRLTLKYFISDVAIENLKDEKFRSELIKHGLMEASEEAGIVNEFTVAEVEIGK